jgi:hypothetical protein
MKEGGTSKLVQFKLKVENENKENIDKIQDHIMSHFATKAKTNTNNHQNEKECDNHEEHEENNHKNFDGFIDRLNNLEYNGYDYQIVPEKDYFKRDTGEIVETILNSEAAAIKKCEEIFNSLSSGESFIDKDFGSSKDNPDLNKYSLYTNGIPYNNRAIDPKLVEWYPITQLATMGDPKFIDDGAESNDVMQGALGDCWFISALSVIASNDYLLRGEFNPGILEDGKIDEEETIMLSTGVYPPLFHGFRRKGLFCFKFFKNFKWRYVIIDDRLPCRKVYNKSETPKLLYGKCRNDNEFWVPLIEKAYAKLHRCYEALIGGFIDDGLVDLTGNLARKVFINQNDVTNPQKMDELWKNLVSSTSKNYDENVKNYNGANLKARILVKNYTMLGCSIDSKNIESEMNYQGKPCGLLAGHAYGVLDAFEIPKPEGVKRNVSRLMRIRNPWGFKEWNGKWSDESDELDVNSDIIQKTLDERYAGTNEKVILNEEDGSFIMCFKDYRSLFNKLFFCYSFPPSVIAIRFKDKWSPEESGGLPVNNTEAEMKSWAKNPQYYMKLMRPSTKIYIVIQQNDGRLTKGKFPYADVTRKCCIIIGRTKGKKRYEDFDGNNMVEICPVRQHRENSVFLSLEAGEYIIVPSIFKAGEIGEFSLELYIQDEFSDINFTKLNFLSKLKNATIEKLGKIKPIDCQLLGEYRSQHFEKTQQMKIQFMLNQFKYMLVDEDEMKYGDDEEDEENVEEGDENEKDW